MNIEINKFGEQFIQSYKKKDDFPFNNEIEFKKFLKRMKEEGKEIDYFVRKKVLPKMVKPKKQKRVKFKFILRNIKHIFSFLLSRQKIPFDYYVERQKPTIKRMLEILKNSENFDKINKSYTIQKNKDFMKEVVFDFMDFDEKIKKFTIDNNTFI